MACSNGNCGIPDFANVIVVIGKSIEQMISNELELQDVFDEHGIEMVPNTNVGFFFNKGPEYQRGYAGVQWEDSKYSIVLPRQNFERACVALPSIVDKFGNKSADTYLIANHYNGCHIHPSAQVYGYQHTQRKPTMLNSFPVAIVKST
jgi:hypothetical protein